MYFDPDDSRFSRDFYRPWTEDALRRLDPQLTLRFNKERNTFQVLRLVAKKERSWSSTFGVTFVDKPVMIDVVDWPRLLDGDDPGPLLAHLVSCDTLRYGKYLEDREQQALDHRRKMEERSRDNARHVYRDNRRQLNKVWRHALDHPDLR